MCVWGVHVQGRGSTRGRGLNTLSGRLHPWKRVAHPEDGGCTHTEACQSWRTRSDSCSPGLGAGVGLSRVPCPTVPPLPCHNSHHGGADAGAAQAVPTQAVPTQAALPALCTQLQCLLQLKHPHETQQPAARLLSTPWPCQHPGHSHPTSSATTTTAWLLLGIPIPTSSQAPHCPAPWAPCFLVLLQHPHTQHPRHLDTHHHGYPNTHHFGHPSIHDPSHPNTHHPGYSKTNCLGHPNIHHPRHPSTYHLGYPKTRFLGDPTTQHPWHPNNHHPDYPKSYCLGHPTTHHPRHPSTPGTPRPPPLGTPPPVCACRCCGWSAGGGWSSPG